jgi:putative ABC transport system permease protein
MFEWLSTGWRQLIANPLFSLITIISLSIGCCGALLAGANIKQHLSFESNFPAADRIMLLRAFNGPAPTTRHPLAAGLPKQPPNTFSYSARPAMKAALQGRVPGMAAITNVISGGSMFVDENGAPTNDQVRYIDPEFFDVFEFRFIEGTRATAIATPNSITLTQSKARELFGDEPALNREIKGVRGVMFRVGAVINDPPAPTMFEFKALASMAARDVGRPSGSTDPVPEDFGRSTTGGTYVRIAPGVDRDAFIPMANQMGIDAFKQGFRVALPRLNAQLATSHMPPLTLEDNEFRVSLIPITQIHLSPREATGVTSTGEISMLVTLGAAAAALLTVSAFNYVVLSLARALRRRREVGVRKVLGASGGAVARHYLAEASLVTAISLALGFGLAELLQPWFARALGQPEVLFNLYDPVFLGATATAFVVLVLLVGAYPALYLANIRPRSGLENADDNGGGMRRRITGGLLGLQIAAATVMLTLALTMAAQARYVAARPLGFNMTNLYSITANCGRRSTPTVASSNQPCSATMTRLMHETRGLKRVAWSSNPAIFMAGEPTPITVIDRPGASGDGFQMAVDADFLPMAGAKLLAGRLFNANSAYDRQQMDAYPTYPAEKFASVPVVVTRATLAVIGAATPQEAIGRRIMIGQNLWTRSMEIVGVIEDWHQRSLKFSVSPVVFVMGGTMMNAVAEIDEADVPAVQAALSPPGGYTTSEYGPFRVTVAPLGQSFQEAYAADRSLMSAVIGFAALSILVACLGVFGMSAFDIQRRVREIGIRKALGATPGGVAGMVLRSSLVSAAIATLLSWPAAWWLSNSWLNGYVYRTSLGLAALPVASAIVVAFVALAVGLNTLKAAAIRPSTALRSA